MKHRNDEGAKFKDDGMFHLKRGGRAYLTNVWNGIRYTTYGRGKWQILTLNLPMRRRLSVYSSPFGWEDG